MSLPWDLPEWSVHCMASLCSIHQKLWLLSCPSPNDPSSSSSNWSLASFANGTRFQHQSAQPKSAVMLLCKFLQNLETSFVDLLREMSFKHHFIPPKMNFRHLELQETCHMLSCQSRGHLTKARSPKNYGQSGNLPRVTFSVALNMYKTMWVLGTVSSKVHLSR